MIEISGKYTTAKIMIDNVEETCIKQIVGFINHPAFTNPVAIMPDTHAGKGSVIGFTMETTDKIIPNTIGVDIGCGMRSVCIGKHELDYAVIDHRIRNKVPMGFEVHARSGRAGSFDMMNWQHIKMTVNRINERFNSNLSVPVSTRDCVETMLTCCDRIGIDHNRAINSIGSLGGGNHFIEFGVDEDDNTWITVHTGSRNFGKKVCDHWQDIATTNHIPDHTETIKKEIEAAKQKYSSRELGEKIKAIKAKYSKTKVPTALEWLEGDDAAGYLYDMAIAQEYARLNREVIMDIICKQLNIETKDYESIECIHNFIDFDDMIIRKGSIRSYENEKMIIPFNMVDGLLICEGKSNPEWNYSSPHGAGRVLSRSAAKRELNKEDVEQQMKDANVFTTNIPLDEAPDAYKDAQIIEDAIEPTAKIIHRVKPIHNIKA